MSNGGLRERKKRRTRDAIQDAALHLYREQGYAQTTLEQVAAVADVSPSTLFRYFPSKPDTVLYDRVDPIVIDAILAQPEELTPLEAVRAALRAVVDGLDTDAATLEATRATLMAQVPELRAAAAQKVEEDLPQFIEAIAQRTGREADDPQVQYWVGALAGVALMAYWRAMSQGQDIYTTVDEALDFLADGISL
ncbi:TetR/AcrR family transcriptional regulator [Aeromicrobium sp. CTD01-1L150]|uniref:TetR/AcrR family transcriptional regulator n=1 Tax=Aeromicrobium sp. CTD01-1L150 TaxID=3341830 RepID=UPI0035BF4D70